MQCRFLAAILLAGATATLSAQSSPDFELMRDTATLQNAGTIVQGDFNNDGKPDVVIGGGATTPWELTLRLGSGDGTFQPGAVIATTNNTFILDLAAADLNHDGNLDLVAVLQDSGFEVWFGNGNGTFQTGVFYATSTGPLTAAPGDFNGDGLVDIAVGDDSGNVEIWNNAGGKTFGLAKTFNVSSLLHLDKLRAANLNGNGITDLVAFNSQAVWAIWGDGQEDFTVDQLKTYLAPVDMNVGDLNGDGRDDIIVSYACDVSTTSGSTTPCTGIDAWYGQGDQKLFYRQLVQQTGIEPPSEIWPVDMNGDGLGDIAGLSTNTSGSALSLSAWLGKPDGSFAQTPKQWYAASKPTNAPQGQYQSYAMVPGDFNRDGMMDFVATLPPQSQSETFINGANTAPCTAYTINDSVTDCLPVNNTYLAPNFVVEAHATDSSPVTALQQYTNGKLVYSTSASSFTWYGSDYAPGSYLFVTKAWDSTGLSFRAVRNLTIFNGSPYPTCPLYSGNAAICFTEAHGESGGNPVFASGSPIHIMANGYAPSIPTAAQLYINGSLVVNNDNCNGGNCFGGTSLVDTEQTLSPGTYDLVFKLWDASGNVEEAQQTINVD